MSLNKKVGLMSLIWTQFYEGSVSVYLYVYINKETVTQAQKTMRVTDCDEDRG